jgi:hypothetical protein
MRLQKLTTAPLDQFDILVPFEVEPDRKATRPSEWIDSAAAADWLRTNGFGGTTSIRQRGGLVLSLEARDVEGAFMQVGDILDRFAARVAIGTSSAFRAHANVHVAGKGEFDAQRPRRRVKVHALARADQVYALSPTAPIDSALELLSHLDLGPPPVEIAAGWSAAEALLLGPGDRSNVAAADRLGALVACSWPRAELTDLAWAKIRQDDDKLSSKLAALKTNREKAERAAGELAAGSKIVLQDTSDMAAARQMSKLLGYPAAVLMDVRAHVAECFRRLYRVRNVILHAGRTDLVGLRATLRPAPPLVGAGMDRIAHAHLVSGTAPLELVARAELEIARAGLSAAPSIVEMLE